MCPLLLMFFRDIRNAAQCVKITQKVSFYKLKNFKIKNVVVDFFKFWRFQPIFGQIKLTCLVTLFLKTLAKLTIFDI